MAWLALIEFIERNGHEFAQPETDDAVETMFGVAAGTVSEAEFVEWVRAKLRPPREQ